LLKRFNTRPAGLVWKNASGARSTRTTMLSCMRVAATMLAQKKAAARSSATTITPAVRPP
jgi:hypothetical protein